MATPRGEGAAPSAPTQTCSSAVEQLRESAEHGTADLININEALRRAISEAQRAENDRKVLLQEYRMMFDSVPAFIWYKDRDNRILRVNRPAADSMGKSVADLEGKSTYDLYPDEAAAYHRDDLEVIKSGRPKLAIIEPVLTKSGEKLWIQTDKVPYRNERGEIIGVIVFGVDISQRIRAEAEVRQLNVELEERVAERTAELEAVNRHLEDEIAERQRAVADLARSNADLQLFAGVASHDLHEPLRKLQALGSMLSSECGEALSVNGRDYLQRIQRAAARMQALITDLLAFSLVETQVKPFARVDLREAVQGVLADLEVRIQETGGHVAVGDLPTLDAEPVQIRQLLQNLIGNALKYHRQGVPPQVRVAADTVVADGRCVLRVEDNGIGFEMQYLERIFLPFQRLHGLSQYEGTGMGLAVCSKIVQRHGGTITARSVPGHGSTFIVVLPVQQPLARSQTP